MIRVDTGDSAMSKDRKKTPGDETAGKSFAQLARLISEAGIRLQPEEQQKAKLPAPVPASKVAEQDHEDPSEAFAEAMAGVDRIQWRHGAASSPAASEPPVFPDPEYVEERLFQEAVGSEAAPPILDHPEYIEGWVGVAGQRFLPQLRAGVYSIQGSIDLHGLTRDEAREAVEGFIFRMSRERSCCVRIVHGRGINSPSDKAVLKEQLQRWLVTRRMSRHVVAYASAPHSDGGVGAIYVLLRRAHP